MIKLLIAEGFPMIAASLRLILEKNGAIEVAGEVADGRMVVAALRSRPIDVLLIGMSLQGANTLDLIRRIRTEMPTLPICAITFADNPRPLAVPALRAGAAGFVTKFSAPEALTEAVSRLARGERYLDAIAVDDIVSNLEAGNRSASRMLSQREIQVFQMLTDGKPMSEIANTLNLSIKTVSTHKTRLYQKLHVHSMAGLVRYAVEHQLMAETASSTLAHPVI